nr:MAG TPA: hypothetical protein [Caudoviricetes sp.]
MVDRTPDGDVDVGTVALVGADGGGLEPAWTPSPCPRVTIGLAAQAEEALDVWRSSISRAILDHTIRLWDGRPEAAETIAVCEAGGLPDPQTIILPDDPHTASMAAILGPERVPDMAVLAARMWAMSHALMLSADEPPAGPAGSPWRVVWRRLA